MRKTPTYDWDWFNLHTPFKKIFEETCEFEVDKEVIPYRVFGNIWSTRNHYNIKVNYPMFQSNFVEIKKRILNTRVCKHNQEIFDWINEMECTKRNACELITDGCMAQAYGSFTWDWCDTKEEQQ